MEKDVVNTAGVRLRSRHTVVIYLGSVCDCPNQLFTFIWTDDSDETYEHQSVTDGLQLKD